MARPIWTGTLSFGLLNVPVSLMSGERSVDLHFRMLDSRSNTPVRYERVNAETGEEVPWKEIVKAFEYAKGSYVVLEPEDIKSAAADGREVVDVKAFVEADSIGPEYFEKPYFLVPGKKAEKGYVLLREVLKRTGRIGIARVVIRTREYLSAVMPRGNALVLMLLRYPQELVDAEDYKIPEGAASQYRISPREIQMAEQLIESMSDEWNPAEYRDEFRDRLRKVIEKRMKSKGVVTTESEDEADMPENATTNVVDFMSLLQKSLASNKRTPAKKTAAKSAGKTARGKSTDKPAGKSTAGKKSAAKKTPAKKRAATRKAG
ncbi:Ku protein [Rhodanobacter sp. Root179]|uniref:non-homologous end joining protein Ku n=1 Tax=unclassified Rhodanobacter TaxID=2621553 RepID=UPI0006FC753A|nr:MULTISPECIES: Ku protein [unclassified Rhodanobacter]KQZ71182.1 DNA-binding protein [Rhodanobacter sp. Root561]KRB52290.1 DNA-binding protein [Rhodanobacter sp. Root179]